MSFINFESLLGPLGKQNNNYKNFAKNIKYGVNYNINFEFESAGKTQGERKAALFSNRATLIGYLKAEEETDISVYDGINETMIHPETGELDGFLAEEAFNKVFGLGKEVSNKYAQYVMLNKYDNCVMIIYNLLRMFAIKSMVESKNKNKHAVAPDDIIYDDGHVRVTAKQFLGIETRMELGKDFRLESRVMMPQVAVLNKFSVPGEDTGPSVHARDFTDSEFAALALACDEWTSDFPYRICHPSFKPFEGQIGINTNRQPNQRDVTFDDTCAKDVKSTIIKLVAQNKMQSHFDMAYAIFCQVLYTHSPRSVEALVWYSKKETVFLPKSGTMRGANMCMVAGLSKHSDVTRNATFTNWVNSTGRCVIHSIALGEASNSSMFEYMTRKDDSTDILSMVDKGLIYRDLRLGRDIALAASRFGCEMSLPWTSAIGLDRSGWLFDGLLARKVEVSILDATVPDSYAIIRDTASTRDYVVLKQLVPLCYPVLSIGIRESKYFMNATKLQVKLQASKAGAYVTSNAHDAHKFMALMRIAGQDVTVLRRSDNKRFSNWAPNANGHYVPTFGETVASMDEELYIFDPQLINIRRQNWVIMPEFGNVFAINYEARLINFQFWGDGLRDTSVGLQQLMVKMAPDTAVIALTGSNVIYASVAIKDIPPGGELQDFMTASAITGQVALQEVWA